LADLQINIEYVLLSFQAEKDRFGQEEETRGGGGVPEDERYTEGEGETQIEITRMMRALAFKLNHCSIYRTLKKKNLNQLPPLLFRFQLHHLSSRYEETHFIYLTPFGELLAMEASTLPICPYFSRRGGFL